MSANLLEELAREKAGMPPEWALYHYHAHGNPGESVLYELRGAVAPLKKSGQWKGHPNFAKKDETTERTVYVTPAELDAFTAHWEAERGKCSKCEGSGQEVASVSVRDGKTYRACSRCKGSGKPPAAPPGPPGV